MTCKQCRYEFCWICLVDWESEHYTCKVSHSKTASHKSLTMENYSFLSMYTVEKQNNSSVNLMRNLLPSQVQNKVASGLLQPDQGELLLSAFHLAAFVRTPFSTLVSLTTDRAESCSSIHA